MWVTNRMPDSYDSLLDTLPDGSIRHPATWRPPQVGTVTSPVLHVRKPRHRDGKYLVRVTQWQVAGPRLEPETA